MGAKYVALFGVAIVGVCAAVIVYYLYNTYYKMPKSMLNIYEVLSTISEIKEFFQSHNFAKHQRLSYAIKLVQIHCEKHRALSADEIKMINAGFKSMYPNNLGSFSIKTILAALSQLEAENDSLADNLFEKFNALLLTETQAVCNHKLQDDLAQNKDAVLDVNSDMNTCKMIRYFVSQDEVDEQNKLNLQIKPVTNFIPCDECKIENCMRSKNKKVLKLGAFVIMNVYTAVPGVYGQDIHIKPCYSFYDENGYKYGNRDYELVSALSIQQNCLVNPGSMTIVKAHPANGLGMKFSFKGENYLIFKSVDPKQNHLGIF
ncbi:hypothetical protein ENBRE01_2470 [Enteropsectra breve]|nr:hypothetical protein ENBRE01_2001 [Enteropsectra breve]KAI5151900.1 hypothetical protein ENBRE01_2470 [Enteropsectra breve]